MNKTIHTPFFRIGAMPSLDAPYAKNATDKPKYGVRMMFPKNGITKPTGRPDSNVAPLLAALNEVCLAEFKCDYATFMQHHEHFGIQYPPKFTDGDTVYAKDPQTQLPLLGQVRPECAGMWILSVKNADPVDLVAPNGQERITAAQMCAGYWARAQIEISAYVTKQNQRVFAVKLINLQLAYVDDKLAMGGGTRQDGLQAFAGMAIADSNVPAGAFNVVTPAGQALPTLPTTASIPGLPASGGVPNGLPAMGGAPVAGIPNGLPAMTPTVPGMPAPQAAAMPAGLPAGLPQAAATPMVPGMPAPQVAAPAPAVASVPGMAVAPGGVPSIPGMPAPAAPQSAAVNTTDRVIMKQGQQPLAAFTAQGWTPELLVQHGYADWNYNYVG